MSHELRKLVLIKIGTTLHIYVFATCKAVSNLHIDVLNWNNYSQYRQVEYIGSHKCVANQQMLNQKRRGAEDKYVPLMRLQGNDCKLNAAETVQNSREQKLLAVYLAFPLLEIRDAAPGEMLYEVVNNLHREDLILTLFKRLMKYSQESEFFTDEVFNEDNDI